MRLEASVPADALGSVRLGAPVEFTVTGYPNRAFHGTRHAHQPDRGSGDAAGADHRVAPERRRHARRRAVRRGTRLQRVARAPIVPQSAVDERGLRPSVVRLKSGRTEKVEVTLGLRDAAAETVEITQGLTPGDTVLLGAARGISAGHAGARLGADRCEEVSVYRCE